jgi:hypothetical protein
MEALGDIIWTQSGEISQTIENLDTITHTNQIR